MLLWLVLPNASSKYWCLEKQIPLFSRCWSRSVTSCVWPSVVGYFTQDIISDRFSAAAATTTLCYLLLKLLQDMNFAKSIEQESDVFLAEVHLA